MRIEHMAVYVNDPEAARDFFVTYLSGVSDQGYQNRTTGFRSNFVTFEDGARLEIMNRPDLINDEKDRDRTGYAHIAFSAGSRVAVDLLTERLRRDGFQVTSGPRTTGDGYYESCIAAIEGNLIEITV